MWESVPGGNARYADCGNCGEKHETYFESNAEAEDTRREMACEAAREAAWMRRNGGGK